ncbi:MAG: Hpt domain-containing protein, partial [Bacteroidota bacterium]
MEKPDLTYLNSITSGDKKNLVEIIELFFDQVPEIQNNFNIALNSRNFEEISAIAHKAKSSVNIIGLKLLAEKLYTLEINAKKDKNFIECEKYVSDFKLVSNQAVIHLK